MVPKRNPLDAAYARRDYAVLGGEEPVSAFTHIVKLHFGRPLR